MCSRSSPTSDPEVDDDKGIRKFGANESAYFAILDALKEAKATAEIGDTLAIKVVKDPETTTSQADYKAQWTKGPGVPDWYQQPQPLVSTPVAEQGDPF